MKWISIFLFFIFQVVDAQIEKINFKVDNPGDLNFYLQFPSKLSDTTYKPLVIALHGCNQSAEGYAQNSGMAELADSIGIYLGLPEQKRFNNMQGCFNWFRSNDNVKGAGELASIIAFIDTLVEKYPIDTNRIYVTGVSAGAAMTVALLVNYTTKFAAGAPLAGGCYCASDFREGFRLMMHQYSLSDKYLKNRLPNKGVQLPPIIIIQGEEDNVVDPASAKDIQRQWILSAKEPITFDKDSINSRINILNVFAGDKLYIHSLLIKDIGHAIPIDEHHGKETLFIKDINFFAMKYIFNQWGLIITHR